MYVPTDNLFSSNIDIIIYICEITKNDTDDEKKYT